MLFRSSSGKPNQRKWSSRTFGEGVRNLVLAWKSSREGAKKGVLEPSSGLLPRKFANPTSFLLDRLPELLLSYHRDIRGNFGRHPLSQKQILS